MKNLLNHVKKQFRGILLTMLVILGLAIANSCDPTITGVVNPYTIASSSEYATFANVYVSAYSDLMPIITALEGDDSYHFWAHINMFESSHDTLHLIFIGNLLQQNSTLNISVICQNVVGAGQDLLDAYPELNIATVEEIEEISEIGYSNNIWPPEFPWIGSPVELKSGQAIATDSCMDGCRRTYRKSKINAIGWLTFEMIGAALVCLVPGQQVSSGYIVAAGAAGYIADAITIQTTYNDCVTGCIFH